MISSAVGADRLASRAQIESATSPDAGTSATARSDWVTLLEYTRDRLRATRHAHEQAARGRADTWQLQGARRVTSATPQLAWLPPAARKYQTSSVARRKSRYTYPSMSVRRRARTACRTRGPIRIHSRPALVRAIGRWPRRKGLGLSRSACPVCCPRIRLWANTARRLCVRQVHGLEDEWAAIRSWMAQHFDAQWQLVDSDTGDGDVG
jgi:hypothetical protein